MRIERVHINGFGHFFDRDFGPLDAPITVFHGPNEAGKSTMLAFLRTALFGFPPRNRGLYPALNGGEHGGRISISDDAGRAYSLEVTERALRLRDADGQLLDQPALDRLLGHASREMFESVFAFSLKELQELDSLDREDAAKRIYAAGMGASRLPAALSAFAKQREELFKHSGHKQRIAGLLADLASVENELRQCESESARFAQYTADRGRLETELTALADRQRALAAEVATAERLARARGDWLRGRAVRERLAALPDTTGFPPDGVVRLERAEEALDNANHLRDEALANRDRMRARADAPVPHAAMLEEAAVVEEVRDKLAVLAKALGDLPNRTKEVAASTAKLAHDIHDIQPSWTIADLEAFEISTETREIIERFRVRLDDTARAEREGEAALSQAREAAAESDGRATVRSQALAAIAVPALDAAGIEAREASLRIARTRLADATYARSHREDVEFQAAAVQPPAPIAIRGPRRARSLVAVGAGAVVAVAFVLSGLALVGLAAFAVGGGIGALLFLRTASPAAVAVEDAFGPRIAELRRAEERCAAAVAESARLLGVESVDAATLDRAEAELRRANDSLAAYDAARQAAQSAADDAAATHRRLANSIASLSQAADASAAAKAEWSTWIASRGLSTSLTPGTVAVVIGRIETARVQLAHLRDDERRVRRIGDDIAEHSARIEGLARRHGLSTGDDGAGRVVAARELIRLFDAATAAHAERQRDIRTAEAAETDLASREQRLATAQAALLDLLRAGRAEDAEAFRLRAEAHEERAQLVREGREAGERLRALVPAHQSPADLDTALSVSTADEVVARLAALGAELEQLDGDAATRRQQLGGVQNALEQLAGGEAASRRHARRAELVEELRTAARDWSRLTIAERLLERARDHYQQQRQPAVLAHAQAFFETVTGGRYDRVFVPLGEKRISVRATDGGVKAPEQLSRGTVEQLYLALRFGLIRQFNEQETCLPIIVDDILVNFDPERAARTAQALVELSATNQVLVFTCQPSTVDLFRAASDGVRVVELADRRAATMARLL